MQQGKEDLKLFFKEPKKISKYLRCPICLELPIDAMYFSCGHTICKKCSTFYIKPGQKTCPIARCEIKTHKGKPVLCLDHTLKNIVDRIPVFCSNKNNGCLEVVDLSSLASHVKTCKFNEDNLPSWIKRFKSGGEEEEKNVELDLADEDFIEEFNNTDTCNDLMTVLYRKNPELMKKALKKSVSKVRKKKSLVEDDAINFAEFLVGKGDFGELCFDEYKKKKEKRSAILEKKDDVEQPGEVEEVAKKDDQGDQIKSVVAGSHVLLEKKFYDFLKSVLPEFDPKDPSYGEFIMDVNDAYIIMEGRSGVIF